MSFSYCNRYIIVLLCSVFSCIPKKEIQLRQIKNIVFDVGTEPILKAEAVFYNPNTQKGKIKYIYADVYVKGNKAAVIDQKLKIQVPSNDSFIVPLEVKLNLKEQGIMSTLLSVVGAKKMKIRYKGYVKVIYRGIPIRVPVDEEEEIQMRF